MEARGGASPAKRSTTYIWPQAHEYLAEEINVFVTLEESVSIGMGHIVALHHGTAEHLQLMELDRIQRQAVDFADRP